MTSTESGWDVRASHDSFMDPEGVELIVATGSDGSPHAALVPRALRSASPEQTVLLSDLQHTAAAIEELVSSLDALVPAAREAGLSWESIGWCIGTTGSAVQKRWGHVLVEPKSKGRRSR